MHRRTASVAACLLTGASLTSAQGSNETIKCVDGLQMLISRGTGEEAGPGVTGAIAKQIADQIDDSAYLATNYPASFTEPVGYFESVANGTLTLGETIKTFAEQCPDTKLAIFGYSQGAQITTNNLCGQPQIWAVAPFIFDGADAANGNSTSVEDLGVDVNKIGDPLDSKYTKNIVSVVLFGDPSHRDDASYNHGSSNGNGIFYRKDFSACEDLGDRIRSYCDNGDPFCDVGKTVDVNVHGTYLKRHGKEVVKFVVDQYKNWDDPDDPAEPSATPPAHNAAGPLMPTLALAAIAPLLALSLM